MKSGPRKGKPSKTDFVAKARAAWGKSLPDWVEVLAEEAARTSGVNAAKAIGYSPALVTHVIGNSYSGDLKGVEERVRGALMGAVVVCPVLGEIRRDRCLDEQKKKFSGASAIRARLFRACRAGCPHSRITKANATKE